MRVRLSVVGCVVAIAGASVPAAGADPSNASGSTTITVVCGSEPTSIVMNGNGIWNTVILDGSLPEQMIKDMIEDSYDLVVSQLPESRRRALGWQTDESPPGCRAAAG